MPGIRLHHDTLRNATVAVECFRSYVGPFICPLCQTTHHHKTVHLNLDNEGDVIVSHVAWEKDLKDVPNLPFTIDGQVIKPPPMILSLGAEQKETPQLIHLPFKGRRK